MHTTNFNPKENLNKAKLWKSIGWVCIIAGMLMGIEADTPLAAIPLVLVGYFLIRKGKRYSVERGEEILSKDNRPPVLYLRSFKDEVEDNVFLKQLKYISPSDKKWLSQTVPHLGQREQDALNYVFKKIGPYISLGKPDENQPHLGSHKIYITNENWQMKIQELFHSSKLIIFRGGKTQGLKWELEKLVAEINPIKLVFILPVTDEDYSSFIQWANIILPYKLSNEYPKSRIVVFDKNWQPTFLPQKQTITQSFSPFFMQNGIYLKETFWEKTVEHNGWRF